MLSSVIYIALSATGGTVYTDNNQSEVNNFEVWTRIPWIYGYRCVNGTGGGQGTFPNADDCAKNCMGDKSSRILSGLCCSFANNGNCEWSYNGTTERAADVTIKVLMNKLGAAGVSALGYSGRLLTDVETASGMEIEPRSQGLGYCTNPGDNEFTFFNENVTSGEECMEWCYKKMNATSLKQVKYTSGPGDPGNASDGSICCQYTPDPCADWPRQNNTPTHTTARYNKMWALGSSMANVGNKCLAMWSAEGATRYANVANPNALSCTPDLDYKIQTDVSVCMAAKINSASPCIPYNASNISCVSDWVSGYIGNIDFRLTYVGAADWRMREYTSWAVNETYKNTRKVTTSREPTWTSTTTTTTSTPTTTTIRSKKRPTSKTASDGDSGPWSRHDGYMIILCALLFGSISLLCMVLAYKHTERGRAYHAPCIGVGSQ